ncbi:hypothetical protein [Amycolatopsis thailandensis]|uniref:hypothetical protein n=1 Tax=Amycolatopsis thailandensis TaxID=589330 RepID=UPI0011781959|nr:hypothetical protein [Amycolatopsis thailandensis]
MGDEEVTPAEMSWCWAGALVRTVNALAPADVLFEANLMGSPRIFRRLFGSPPHAGKIRL